MKELEKVLFDSDSHIVIVGRTGSGKSHTVAKIIELLMKNGKVFILMDYAGEYRIPGISSRQPVFSYPLLRSSLAEVMSEIIRLQSATAGTWTYDSVAKAVEESPSMSLLMEKLRENSEFPVRDSGAKAAYIRLNMLRKYFTDDANIDIIWHIDLSSLDITSRKMASTFYLVQIYNMILTGKLQNQYGLYVIVEEAINIPENLLIQLLTQLRGYGAKIILTTQEYRDWFSGYNLIIHDLGNVSPYRYNIPRNNLKIGEIMLYNVEKHKWKKVRVKPPKIVELLPKSQNNIEQEENRVANIENETQSREEVGSETQVYSEEESTNSDKEEHSDNTEETETTNINNARLKTEVKVLAEEIKSIHYTLSELEGAITELKSIRNEELNEVRKEIEWLQNSVRKLEERVDGLENLVKNSIYSIRDELKEMTSKLREEMISEINQKVDSIFNNNTKDEEYEDLIETEKRIIQSRLANAANLLIISKEYDKVIVRPNRYLGDKFREINLQLQRLGYRLDRDKEHRWYWWKSIYSVKSNA